MFGAPSKPMELGIFPLLGGRKSVCKVLVSAVLKKLRKCWIFCAENNIVSDIELIDIKDITNAYERMLKGDVRYRFYYR